MKKIVSNVILALCISVPAFGMGPNLDNLAADDQAANLPPEIQLFLKVSDDVSQAAKKVEEASSAETTIRNGALGSLAGLFVSNLSSIWGGIKSTAGYVADTRIARFTSAVLIAPFDYTVGAAAQKTGLAASVANSAFVQQDPYYFATAGGYAYNAARYALGLATVYAAYRVYSYATTPASQKKDDDLKDMNAHVRENRTLGVAAAKTTGTDTYANNNTPARQADRGDIRAGQVVQQPPTQSPRAAVQPKKAVPAQQKKARFQEPVATPQAQQNNQSMSIEQAKNVVEALCSDLRGSTKNLLAKHGQALSSNMWLKAYGYSAAHKCTMPVEMEYSYCRQLAMCLKGIDDGQMKRDEVLEKCVKLILNNITHIIKSQSKK